MRRVFFSGAERLIALTMPANTVVPFCPNVRNFKAERESWSDRSATCTHRYDGTPSKQRRVCARRSMCRILCLIQKLVESTPYQYRHHTLSVSGRSTDIRHGLHTRSCFLPSLPDQKRRSSLAFQERFCAGDSYGRTLYRTNIDLQVCEDLAFFNHSCNTHIRQRKVHRLT